MRKFLRIAQGLLWSEGKRRMTNEQYIMSHISEIDLADMFNTGNVYHTDLLIRIQAAFEEWKRNYQYKRSDSLLFQLWLTFQYNEKEWRKNGR